MISKPHNSSECNDPEIEKLALELWREREMRFPAFCRRMTPDDLDRETVAHGRA